MSHGVRISVALASLVALILLESMLETAFGFKLSGPDGSVIMHHVMHYLTGALVMMIVIELEELRDARSLR